MHTEYNKVAKAHNKRRCKNCKRTKSLRLERVLVRKVREVIIRLIFPNRNL